jgi:hypothetical protein
VGIGSFFAKRIGHIAGAGAIKAGSDIVQGLGKRVFNRRCPKCGGGRLSTEKADRVADDGKPRRFRACDRCTYAEPVAGATELEMEELRETFRDRLEEMSEDDVRAIMRTHQVSFRIYLAVAVAALSYSVIGGIVLERGSVMLPAAGFALLFLTLAMKSSYRYWQIETGAVFRPGSFRAWWKQGRWIV